MAQQLNVPEASLAIKQIAVTQAPGVISSRSQATGWSDIGKSEAFELVFADSTHTDDSGSTRILSETVIAVTSPASENNNAFLQVQRAFAGLGLRVPAQFASDLDHGFFSWRTLATSYYRHAESEHSGQPVSQSPRFID